MTESTAIYVAMRCRPFVPREQERVRCIECDGSGTVQLYKDGAKNDFPMDIAIDSSVESDHISYGGQAEMYAKVGKKVLKESVEGFTTCLFAYGQTGSGKTTSLIGDLSPPEARGILPRLLNELFHDIAQKREKEGWNTDVRVRMIEVYNERVNDLLRPLHGTGGEPLKQKKLDVRSHPKFGTYVPDLTIEPVESTDDCMKLLEYGNAMKVVAATAMNAKSSRGHTLFILKVDKSKNIAGTSSTESNEIFITDLAGRENERNTQVTGERLVELSFINKSLFHLANCVAALGGKSLAKTGDRQITTANFRNSKLTLLLQGCLSGNSKTFMIGTLSPSLAAYEENAVTLRFAAQVKNISLATGKNTQSKMDLTAQLQAEVEALKSELETARLEHEAFHKPAPRGTIKARPTRNIQEVLVLKEELEAAQEAIKELTTSLDEAKGTSAETTRRRGKTIHCLGLQHLHYMKNLEENLENIHGFKIPLPYISNESPDPYMSHRLCYSFGKKAMQGSVLYFGSESVTLKKFVEEAGEYKMNEESGHDNVIELRGIGLSPILCRMSTFEDKDPGSDFEVGMDIKRLEGAGPVRVNGMYLREGETKKLTQADKVVLGRAYVFRVHLDTENIDEAMRKRGSQILARKDPFDSMNNVKIAIQTLLSREEADDDNLVYLAQTYITHLRSTSVDQDTKVSQFLYEAVKAQHLVDEANEITNCLRPGDGLKFELEATHPVLFMGYPDSGFIPDLCVRLVRARTSAEKKWRKVRAHVHAFVKGDAVHGAPDSVVTEQAAKALLASGMGERFAEQAILSNEAHGSAYAAKIATSSSSNAQADEVEILSIWSMSKFLLRLDMMREQFHLYMNSMGDDYDPTDEELRMAEHLERLQQIVDQARWDPWKDVAGSYFKDDSGRAISENPDSTDTKAPSSREAWVEKAAEESLQKAMGTSDSSVEATMASWDERKVLLDEVHRLMQELSQSRHRERVLQMFIKEHYQAGNFDGRVQRKK